MIRIIILAFIVAGAFAVYRIVRGDRRTRLPPAWGEAAERSTVVSRVVERRARLAKLLRRTKNKFARGLLKQIDALIETLVELVEARIEMLAHVGDRRLDEVAEPLRLAVEDTNERLEEAEAQIIEACDQVLAILSANSTDAVASAKTRLEEQTDRLRTSVSSYEEARRIARGESE